MIVEADSASSSFSIVATTSSSPDEKVNSLDKVWDKSLDTVRDAPPVGGLVGFSLEATLSVGIALGLAVIGLAVGIQS